MNIESIKIKRGKVDIKATGVSYEDDLPFAMGAGLKFNKPPHTGLLRAFDAFAVLIPDIMGYTFLDVSHQNNLLSIEESRGYAILEKRLEDGKESIANHWLTTEIRFSQDKRNRKFCIIKGELRNNVGLESKIECFPVYYEENNLGYERIVKSHVSILKKEIEVYYKTDDIQTAMFENDVESHVGVEDEY